MYRKQSFYLAAALTLTLLVGCKEPSAAQSFSPAPESAPVESIPVLTVPESPPGPTPEDTAPVPTFPESPPGPTSLPWPVYQFGVPVEESGTAADDSIFEHAVFLGDSRTEGLELFGGLKHGTFYWARGMNVFHMDDEEYSYFPIDGENYTLLGALRQRSYDAVYIMLGVNELGYSVEGYEAGLSALVDKVLDAQPEAVVYLQLMPPLNDAMCRASGLPDYYNNDRLRSFNEVVRRVAAEKKVALLNTAEVYTGADGQLPVELAHDGYHFAFNAYSIWADYLRSHVLDRERYFCSREQA